MTVDSMPIDSSTYKSLLTAPKYAELASFLDEWFSTSSFIELQTSGSTGAPKKILVEKKRMINSALMTCSFLGLKESMRSLLAMPLKYIGARMVVVRSLAVGMDLVCTKPSMHPMSELDRPVDFAALTPSQASASLEDPKQAALLAECGCLILGGGAVSSELQTGLSSFKGAVWSTYGMTETLSHVALRRLNGDSADEWYRPLDGVQVGTDERGALFIDAPRIAPVRVQTNDLAQISEDGGFKILGRIDNIINSGGVKIQLEAVEEALAKVISSPFMAVGAPDPVYGESCTLLIEGDGLGLTHESNEFHVLDRYARPKHVFSVDSLPRTGSGKPDRARARAIAERLLGEAA